MSSIYCVAFCFEVDLGSPSCDVVGSPIFDVVENEGRSDFCDGSSLINERMNCLCLASALHLVS